MLYFTIKKLRTEKWFLKVVQSMYRNAQSQITVNGTFSENFLVQIRLHQSSALSPLLFIITLEAQSGKIREGFPEELLYGDDVVLVKHLRA